MNRNDVTADFAFNEAQSLLCRRIETAQVPEYRLLRLEVDVPELCLSDWLAGQHELPRYYWCDRRRRMEMAGIGEAHVIAPRQASPVPCAFMQIKDRLPVDNPHARYYGGFRFHFNSRNDPQWRHFKPCRFVVPLVELYREGKQCRLACTLNGDDGKQAALTLVNKLHFHVDKRPIPLPRFHARSNLPEYAAWCALVEDALRDFNKTNLEKVVLARQTVLHAHESIDPMAFIQRLYKLAKNVYLFCFQPDAARAFLGASPERLYKRAGDRISSEALAGTSKRGVTAAEDLSFERALLINEKDNREHQIVVKTIMEILSGFCSELQSDTVPHSVSLSHCRHLCTLLTGILRPGITDNALLNALHPTPAVGGKPTAEAMNWILQNEPFERGIYASPVGWVGTDSAEFCVGIRSGLVADKTLNLYTGAGIVAGSDPHNEWIELDTKLAQFMDIIEKVPDNGSP